MLLEKQLRETDRGTTPGVKKLFLLGPGNEPVNTLKPKQKEKKQLRIMQNSRLIDQILKIFTRK